MNLNGSQDKGVWICTAYRVCQEKSNNQGPLTAYQREYEGLIDKGIMDPNPRQQVLDDLLGKINQCRAKGYCPILMMDANGDPYDADNPDKQFLDFFKKAQLWDPYKEKHPGKIRMYLDGKKQIDF